MSLLFCEAFHLVSLFSRAKLGTVQQTSHSFTITVNEWAKRKLKFHGFVNILQWWTKKNNGWTWCGCEFVKIIINLKNFE